MIRELLRSKRKRLVGAAVVCVVLIAGLAMLWHGGRVAEAAVLYPHPGLVGWWRFDEGVGSVAEDSSGFGNDGTVYGATWVDGKYGKALSFDGTNDYVKVADSASLDIVSEISIEVWVKPLSYTPFLPRIVSKGDLDAYWMQSESGGGNPWQFGIRDSEGKAYYVDSATSSALNTWTHVVGVFDGQKLYIYVNGKLDGTRNIGTRSIKVSDQPLYVGATPGVFYYNGLVDEACICNRALSAAEIQEIFQNGPYFSSRLLAKVPKGTTQFIVTLSWQGIGSINITIESPSKNYTEDMVPVYQKTVYSSSSGDMLNIKRVAISVAALRSDENWYVTLEFDGVKDYRITVEVQK